MEFYMLPISSYNSVSRPQNEAHSTSAQQVCVQETNRTIKITQPLPRPKLTLNFDITPSPASAGGLLVKYLRIQIILDMLSNVIIKLILVMRKKNVIYLTYIMVKAVLNYLLKKDVPVYVCWKFLVYH